MTGKDNLPAPAPLSQRATRLVERLKHRRSRVREGMVLVEGPRCVSAALAAGVRVRLAVVTPGLADRPDGFDLLRRLEDVAPDLRVVSEDDLGTLSDTESPQGVLVVVEEPAYSLHGLTPGRWLVLDAVQDPGNAGTLVRAAAAFAADGVVALDGTVDLWSAKAVRASAGLVFAVPVVRVDPEALVRRCVAEEVEILVADAGGTDVAALHISGAAALVVGNEGAGVREALAGRAERKVSVPMTGPAESLNVGVAGSILLYAISRQR